LCYLLAVSSELVEVKVKNVDNRWSFSFGFVEMGNGSCSRSSFQEILITSKFLVELFKENEDGEFDLFEFLNVLNGLTVEHSKIAKVQNYEQKFGKSFVLDAPERNSFAASSVDYVFVQECSVCR
jgi:hypothetical protein